MVHKVKLRGKLPIITVVNISNVSTLRFLFLSRIKLGELFTLPR